jgi:hypothetical protein
MNGEPWNNFKKLTTIIKLIQLEKARISKGFKKIN